MSVFDGFGYNNVVYVCDYNLSGIDWLTLEGNNAAGELFIDTVLDNMLSQQVTQPTRGTNILDFVLTDNTDLIDSVSVSQPFCNSDHNTIIVNFSLKYEWIEENVREIYQYSKGDYISMNREIESMDWKCNFDRNTCEENWQIFKPFYDDLIKMYVPVKIIKPGKP